MPEISKSKAHRECWHRPDRVKRCIACSDEKPLDQFYAYRYTTRQGKLGTRYESRCKECARARRADQYRANPEKEAEANRRRRERDPDIFKRLGKSYRETEHGRLIKAKAQRLRKARMRSGATNNDPRIAALYQEAMNLEKKLGECVETDDPLEITIHVDHIMPLSKGGKHVFENLQILDARENLEKGASCPK